MYKLSLEQNLNLTKRFNQPDGGFTLIETMIVLVMVGILSAIAAPSWINFINQRRVNAANDAVSRMLQDAQREAKNQKLSYSVSFKTDNTNKLPNFALHRADVTANSSLTYGSTTAQTITFDYNGNLLTSTNPNLGNRGLIISVAQLQSANSTQVNNSSRRCVKVTTLLGALQIGKAEECNTQ